MSTNIEVSDRCPWCHREITSLPVHLEDGCPNNQSSIDAHVLDRYNSMSMEAVVRAWVGMGVSVLGATDYYMYLFGEVSQSEWAGVRGVSDQAVCMTVGGARDVLRDELNMSGVGRNQDSCEVCYGGLDEDGVCGFCRGYGGSGDE